MAGAGAGALPSFKATRTPLSCRRWTIPGRLGVQDPTTCRGQGYLDENKRFINTCKWVRQSSKQAGETPGRCDYTTGAAHPTFTEPALRSFYASRFAKRGTELTPEQLITRYRLATAEGKALTPGFFGAAAAAAPAAAAAAGPVAGAGGERKYDHWSYYDGVGSDDEYDEYNDYDDYYDAPPYSRYGYYSPRDYGRSAWHEEPAYRSYY